MYDQRDVVLVPFPYSDLTASKQRPALIISNDKLNKTEDRICCLITSKTHKNDLEIKGKDFQEGKLPFRSSVKPQRIFTIHKNIIKKRLCKMTDEFHNELLKRVHEYLEIL